MNPLSNMFNHVSSYFQPGPQCIRTPEILLYPQQENRPQNNPQDRKRPLDNNDAERPLKRKKLDNDEKQPQQSLSLDTIPTELLVSILLKSQEGTNWTGSAFRVLCRVSKVLC